MYRPHHQLHCMHTKMGRYGLLTSNQWLTPLSDQIVEAPCTSGHYIHNRAIVQFFRPGRQCCLTAELRLVQVGSGSRSEKIKTYNYKDSRVSDHRTKTNYSLERMLEGDLEECIQSLIAMDQKEQLAELQEA